MVGFGPADGSSNLPRATTLFRKEARITVFSLCNRLCNILSNVLRNTLQLPKLRARIEKM